MKKAVDRNIEKLTKIEEMEETWNGYSSVPFSHDFISFIKNEIRKLEIQPQIFPIAGGKLQLEYDRNDGGYLEFEVSPENMKSIKENKSAKIEFYYEFNKEQEEGIVENFEKINEKVMNFYKDLLSPMNNQPFIVSNEQLSKMKRNKKNEKNEKRKDNVKIRNALNKETTADEKIKYSIPIKDGKGVRNI